MHRLKQALRREAMTGNLGDLALDVLWLDDGSDATNHRANLAAALNTVAVRLTGCAEGLSSGTDDAAAAARARDLATLAKRITKHLARASGRTRRAVTR